MADGFKDKDGKFRPTEDRSPFPSKLKLQELLPKEEKEVEQAQSDRRGKFALEKAKQFASKAKSGAGHVKNKVQEERSKRTAKQLVQKEAKEDLDNRIDKILAIPSTSDGSGDSEKFRKLQRFGIENRRKLTKQQLGEVNSALRELDVRIKKRREKDASGATTSQRPRETSFKITPSTPAVPAPTPSPSTALTQDQFDKLPEELKQKVRIATGG